jgi:hypothetical protein
MNLILKKVREKAYFVHSPLTLLFTVLREMSRLSHFGTFRPEYRHLYFTQIISYGKRHYFFLFLDSGTRSGNFLCFCSPEFQ